MALDYNDNHYRTQRPEFSMEITSVTPSQIDLAVVGAGPHALTLVTHLLQKCQKKRGKFWVFDPSGR
ncbi:FAD/NAD(P)-binding protein, partial [Microcoleus anatoxicus]|uniref:FAD/NAD(P)-binding protein n=1 Tax=Microcoleus anatoxicus TaxID=2705319 RepID=UPI0030C9E070